MKYQTKLFFLSVLKFLTLTSVIVIFISPNLLATKISAGILGAALLIQAYLKYLIRIKYQKDKKSQDQDPEYLFEWLCISWVGTLLGLFIPGFLYGQDIIALGELKNVLNGLVWFLILYSAFMYFRHLRTSHRKSTFDKNRTTPPKKRSEDPAV